MVTSSILLVLSALMCLGLGAGVWLNNRRARLNISFAALCLNLALWSLGVLAVIHSTTEAQALICLRSTFIVASFLPLTFYVFTAYFPTGFYRGSELLTWFLGTWGCLIIIGSFSKWYISSIDMDSSSFPMPKYGPVFLLYFGYVGTTAVAMLVNLVRKLKKSTGLARRQLHHGLLGIFSTILLAIATNIICPVLEIDGYEAYGPAFNVLMASIFAYAIVRYNLLHIRVILQRTTVYAASMVLVIGVFVATVGLTNWLFTKGGRASDVLSTVLAAALITVVLQPAREHLQRFLDRTLLKRHYDTGALLTRLNSYISQHVHLDELIRNVCCEIGETVGVNGVRVLLCANEEPGVLIREYSTIAQEGRACFQYKEPLLEHLRTLPEPLLKQRLLDGKPTEEKGRVADCMTDLDAYLCLPLRTSSSLIGVLVLGEKTSRDMYCPEDILLFSTLADRLGTAIENARLYRRLEEFNENLTSILSNMREGVIAVNAAGVVTEANRSARELMKKLRIGQTLDELPEQIREVLRVTLAEGQPVASFETKLECSDGSEIPALLSSARITVANSGQTGAMALVYDLTRLKELEGKVQRADRLTSIGTLAAGMAHEIKNPLVSIKTFTQLLPARYDDIDFRDTFREVVPHEVERINSIVSRLLDFARPKPADFRNHDLQEIVREVLALVENQVRKANIEVEMEFPAAGVTVYGDEQQLHQVFLNLVLNAIDACHRNDGGTLKVSATMGRAHLRRNGHIPQLGAPCVKVTVADTGEGIPEDALKHLFTPFFTTKDNGCGLGLSVVHGIVAEHGGEIDVHSSQGMGTSFVVTLPLDQTMVAAKGA